MGSNGHEEGMEGVGVWLQNLVKVRVRVEM